MAKESAKVAVLDMLETEGRDLAAELTAAGNKTAVWAVDAADEAEMKAAIDAAAERFGSLHVMVNSAGISGSSQSTDLVTESECDRAQAVNVKGVVVRTKHAIPHLHLRKAGAGSIINLSSIIRLIGIGGSAPYHALKCAVRLMSKNDAIIYAAEKIRANSIHPTYTWTLTVENHLRQTSDDLEAAKAAARAIHPIGDIREPDDIVWAMVWLASDEAKLVIGAEIVVNSDYTV